MLKIGLLAALAATVVAVILLSIRRSHRQGVRRIHYDAPVYQQPSVPGLEDDEKTIGNVNFNSDWDDEKTIGAVGDWDDEKTISIYNTPQPSTQDPDWLDSTVGAYQQSIRPKQASAPSPLAQNPDTASFSQPVRPAQPSPQPRIPVDLEETIAPDRWRVQSQIRFEVDEEGDAREEVVRFQDWMDIGREEDCKLRLTLPYVSRRHLRIRRENGVLTVENLSYDKTEDYTLLNHDRIPNEPVQLRDGDLLEIADTRLSVHVIRL